MEDFCGGVKFWDSRLTWTNNSWPQFTECFQNTALQWVPCGWLWIAGPLYIYILMGAEKKPQPIKCLFCTKLFCSLVLILVAILDIIVAVDASTHHGFDAELLAPLLWIVTAVLHCVLVTLERSRNVVRSPVLFLFWILAAIGTLVPFYSAIKLQMYDTEMFRFAVLCLKYVTLSLLVLLNCFAEYHAEKPKGHNPELSASVLSWITYAWLDRTLVKGFKSPLTSDDVYNLHPRDVTGKVVKKFLNTWEKERTRKFSKAVKRRQKHGTVINEEEEADEKTSLLSSVSQRQKHTSFHSFDSGDNIKLNDHRNSDNSFEVTGNDSVTERNADNVELKVSFFRTCVLCYWREIFRCQWGMVMYVAMSVISPIVLGWLISFTEDPSEPTWHGYFYALAFIVCKIFYTVFGVMSKFLTNSLSIRVRSAAIAAVFRKALTMSNEARKESTVGEIVNLMAVDSVHLEMMVNYSFWMWISWAFLILSIYLLYTVIGIALLAGLGFVLIMFLVNFWTMNKMREYQDQIMKIKDERVKIVNEVLNGIKVIKLYGWEPMFIEKIKSIRDRELWVLLKYAILDGIQSFAWLAAMFWMMYFMLIAFVITDDNHHLDANTSFLTMNYIDVLKLAINIMPIIVKDWIKAANSVMRMGKFLNSEDINQDNLFRDRNDRLAVRIMEADFSWEKRGLRILRNINILVEPGQLVAIVGAVGAGKSSLLSAMLGEMHKLRGYSNLNSTVAYVPQQAWIQNDTLKGNILFGRPYDAQLYQQVVSACALQPDLDIMQAGDSTEIGEKGINLSGGQKQRVSLARAVYSQADIYLMDDPLSAVDSHVGKHIFEHVLSRQGMLNGKTRLLVTHGVQWLPHVDHIIVMSNGKISESGSYEQLIKHNGPFAHFLAQYLIAEETADSEEDENSKLDEEIKADMLRRLASVTSDSDSALSPETPHVKRLISEEMAKSLKQRKKKHSSQSHSSYRNRTYSELSSNLELSQQLEIPEEGGSSQEERGANQSRLTSDEDLVGGKVRWSCYWELIKGMGIFPACVILFLMACYHVSFNLTNIWLADWSDDLELDNFTAMPANSSAREDRNTFYIGVFTGLGIAQTIFVVAYAILLQVRHISASRKLHAELLDCIMRAPMSFFDTTPMGRILNRFSQDIEILDNDIFLESEIALDNALRCVGTVIVISYTMPIFISVVVPVLIVLYIVQQFYIRTSCQLRRIASNNRSPVFAHFSETLSGVSVIRAYQAQDRFITDSQNKIDNFQKATSAAWAVLKWLETRLDMLSYIVVAAAGIFAVVSRNDISPGLVGLAVTYALRVSLELNIFTILFGELETHIVSVERIREYSVIESEAPWTIPRDDVTVDDQWPSHGEVQFVDYSTRYREGLDLVLKGINCTIKGGEKVGIIGRTGAGKSSMVLSLFRLIEAAGGKVIIDGVDISQIGLHALRRKLTILPQDPVLFAGSLRMNLDPFQEKSDSELWTALEHSHLRSFVDGLPCKLDHEVGEGGENLSMGQRQLVCLARTLLRKTQILILDEATAAVDMETDDLIQKTIRTEFSGCTILTIAHRLNTIMDYDRILVLDKGTVAEFDSPKNLLSDPNSIFFSMASNAGLTKDESKPTKSSHDSTASGQHSGSSSPPPV